MSDHDDTLLDEDLGDEEYDLGNDEEEALLADDYDLERQNSYKGEEETDDVLDLGVTDALDDLEGEDENIECTSANDNHSQKVEVVYFEQEEVLERGDEQRAHHFEKFAGDDGTGLQVGDLREKLQRNVHREVYPDGRQNVEDDDGEEARERRNRFQNERTTVSGKTGNEIPDSLESVVTAEHPKQHFRGRGRGRGAIRGSRGTGGGGRFGPHGSGRFNNNICGVSPMENQQLQFRPPLLEHNASFPPGPPPNQQIMFSPNGPQLGGSYPQFPQNGAMLGPPHFLENQAPGPMMGQFQSPRHPGPRMDFGPRGPPTGPMSFSCPPNQGLFIQQQQGHFPNPGMMQGIPDNNQGRAMPNNQAHPSMIQPNLGGPMHANPMIGNQPPPMMPPVRIPPGQPHQNPQVPSQSMFDNRPPPFSEPRFEPCPVFENRPPYNDQFGNNGPPQQVQQPQINVPHVSLPPGGGHKILINPHFRGNVQAPPDGSRLAWENQQQQPSMLQVQITNDQFSQQQSPYQNQSVYNQPSTSHRSSQEYQSNYQQHKSDDPYSYFSDVWQENKSQRLQGTVVKPYNSESNFPRDDNYSNYDNKYRSDNQWNHREEQKGSHQNYREREIVVRPRIDNSQKSRASMSNNVYTKNNDQSYVHRPVNNRSSNVSEKPVPKRSGENIEKSHSNEVSPTKRSKNNSRNLQEVRTTSTIDENATEKKEDDNEDPEMREYRKKMEEQKRLREQILREKENRRKMAAMEKQVGEGKSDASAAEHEAASVVTNIVAKENLINKARPTGGKGRPIVTQSAETPDRNSGTRIVRTIKTVQPNEVASGENASATESSRRVVIQNRPLGFVRKVVQATPNNQRIVVQKAPVSSRKELRTNTVTVDNLSATTSETQLRRMCQNIGSIESIHMGEGSATIVFKTQSAAMVFHKKYQRKMLDLSLITVRLVPQTTAANAVKKS